MKLGEVDTETVPRAQIPAFLAQLAAVQAALVARLLEPTPVTTKQTVDWAAQQSGLSSDYFYKNADTLPFIQRKGRRVVVDVTGFEKWNAKRQT